MNILLFMMGGKGTRFGSEVPKQFYKLNNRPLFSYILDDLENIEVIDKIVVLTNPEYRTYTQDNIKEKGKINLIVDGGKGRSQDILTCLKLLKNTIPDDSNILIYDATHPFVDQKGVTSVIENLNNGYNAVTLAEYQYDTTYTIDPQTNIVNNLTDRKVQVAGASPEGFKFSVIYNIFTNSSEEELNMMTSAGAIALKNNIPLLAVKTEVVNLKITYPEDMYVVEQLINKYGKI